MKNNNFKKDELDLFTPITYRYKLEHFKIFNQLCDKAKELLFVYQHKEGIPYGVLDVIDLEQELLEMSPIEQILSIALNIYGFYITKEFMMSFNTQEVISCGDKEYKADFYIESVYQKDEEVSLKKPLIIECDGFDYHSNKEQMEYDYSRENDLKANGYDVMRFTGSQIYNKPFECVEKIYAYISKNLEG